MVVGEITASFVHNIVRVWRQHAILALALLGLIFPDTHLWRLYMAWEMPEPVIYLPAEIGWEA